MSRRTHSLNAYEVALTSGISDVDTSFPVESTVGLIAPGYLVLDPDDPIKREYFRFETINGQNLEMPNTGFRGLTGSASGASAHLAGARVRAVAVGQWLDDIFADIADLEAADAAFLTLDGSRAMTGDLNMGGKQVQVLGEGVLADDAITKAYADLIRTDFEAEDLTFLKLDGTRPMTGALLHADGTAALPSISFDSLPDAGWYLEQVSPVRISIGIAETPIGTFTENGLEMNGLKIAGLLAATAAGQAVEFAQMNTIFGTFLPLSAGAGNPLTGALFSGTGRSMAIQVKSGQSTANSTHAYIGFVSDVDANQSQVIGFRGNSLNEMGILFKTYFSGGFDSLLLHPNGGVEQRRNVGVNEMRVRNMVVNGTPTEQHTGDVWFDAKIIKYWNGASWQTLGTLN